MRTLAIAVDRPRLTSRALASLASGSLLLAACGTPDEQPPTQPVKQALPALERTTQHDLARELEAADRRGTWNEVKRRWQGQSVRWNVTRHAALCGSPDACNVAVFPVQRPAQQGWLPELRFAAGQYAALEAHCAKREHCDVTIEGVLAHLEISGELPTNVTLGEVRIVPTTAQR